MFLDQTLLFRSTIGLFADKWSYCGDLLEETAVGFGQTMAAVMWNAYDLNKFGCSLGGTIVAENFTMKRFTVFNPSMRHNIYVGRTVQF
ncbi:hypothetical protein LOK49_LG15G00383 [Camellia lanceoleosa]|uniref:Uncharacterized protein n=1 Tax=Camellia lanceoleosa TaxID=1840588 RepID=A0ACC0FA62_9ERIC|nr:hypothetical protein LOK49_LG15G00383 [Camellia lanceoleosa]